jgi:hypothetical protein
MHQSSGELWDGAFGAKFFGAPLSALTQRPRDRDPRWHLSGNLAANLNLEHPPPWSVEEMTTRNKGIGITFDLSSLAYQNPKAAPFIP